MFISNKKYNILEHNHLLIHERITNFRVCRLNNAETVLHLKSFKSLTGCSLRNNIMLFYLSIIESVMTFQKIF